MVGFEDHTDETGMLISRESTAEVGELVFLVRIVRWIDDEKVWHRRGDLRNEFDCIQTSYRDSGQGATRVPQAFGIADDRVGVRPCAVLNCPLLFDLIKPLKQVLLR